MDIKQKKGRGCKVCGQKPPMTFNPYGGREKWKKFCSKKCSQEFKRKVGK